MILYRIEIEIDIVALDHHERDQECMRIEILKR
jgi:hypothetical protein